MKDQFYVTTSRSVLGLLQYVPVNVTLGSHGQVDNGWEETVPGTLNRRDSMMTGNRCQSVRLGNLHDKRGVYLWWRPGFSTLISFNGGYSF